MNHHSLALRDIPHPDYTHTVIEPLPAGASVDPAEWARRIFDLRRGPRWVGAAMAVREAIVPLLGIARSPDDTFDVREVTGHEALIVADERHLDFRCAVAVTDEGRTLRIVTAVRLHGARGRVYFAPVRIGHPLVIRALVRRAVRAKA